MKKIVCSVISNNKTINIDIDIDSENPLDGGAQGDIYKITAVNDKPTTQWVIKLLKTSSESLQERLQAFVDFIKRNNLNTEGLACTPDTLLQTDFDDRIGFIMRRAPGMDIRSVRTIPARGTLSKRLAAATQLARCVRRLHEKGMIIGDLSYDNTIIDPEPTNWALYLIDIDGGGFSWKEKQYALTHNNSGKGQLCPPEYSFKTPMPYVLNMDLWGLAIILHRVLTDKDPITDFGLARIYANPKKDIEWPPPNHAKSHLEKLDLLGKPLKEAFIHVFNDGRTQPDERPTACKWELLLDEAQNHVYECKCNPKQPFVALEDVEQIMKKCPYCDRSLARR